jgi:hypothetical protein
MIGSSVARRGARPPRPLPWLAAVAVLLSAALAGRAAGQAAGSVERELVVHVFELEHQPASEAWNLVQPLLSARGSVELRPADNTLVLRDTMAALERVLPVLVAFDHPPRDVNVEIWLIRASDGARVSPVPPPRSSNVPRELLGHLAGLFHYQQYDLVADSRVRSREGQRVTFQLGPQHSVRFRLGTIVGDQRLRLVDFEVFQEERGKALESLIRSNLNLWLGRNMVFALSQGEQSPTALMVVVRCRQAAPARGGRS